MLTELYYELSVVASRQQGLVTAAQTSRVGADRVALDEFEGAGLLVELDWGVYQLASSYLAPRFAYAFAAWLALSPEQFAWERTTSPVPDAVVSHESAVGVLGLVSIPAPRMVFTATAPREEIRASKIHVAALTERDVTTVSGVPVTTPHRTIVDLVRDWTNHDDIASVLTGAVDDDLVDLGHVYRDLEPLAEEYAFPGAAPDFVRYFLKDLAVGALSPRNLRSYALLAAGETVEAVRGPVDFALMEARGVVGPSAAVADDVLSRDLAAEIVGRLRWSE